MVRERGERAVQKVSNRKGDTEGETDILRERQSERERGKRGMQKDAEEERGGGQKERKGRNGSHMQRPSERETDMQKETEIHMGL